MKEFPEKYWHCYVKIKDSSYFVINDMLFEQLERQVLIPWMQSRPFTIAGAIVRELTQVEEIRICYTEESQQVYARKHDIDMRANSIADMATDRSMLPIWQGKDYTFELLFNGELQVTPAVDEGLVGNICKRIHYTAKILAHRQRKGKNSYHIEDEYDVQDLLHAVLRAYLKYSVQEDPLQKVAGIRSSRADISIEELGILIEVKYVRGPDDQKQIFQDFSQDLVLYAAWQPLKLLLFVIYNSGDLRDPEALEKLSGIKEINGKRFNTIIILV